MDAKILGQLKMHRRLKHFKLVVWLLPVFLFAHIFAVFGDTVTIFSDIGSSTEKIPLTPNNRVSGPMNNGSASFRHIYPRNDTYFSVKVPYGTSNVTTQIRFKGNDSYPVALGISKNQTYSYFVPLYTPDLDTTNEVLISSNDGDANSGLTKVPPFSTVLIQPWLTFDPAGYVLVPAHVTNFNLTSTIRGTHFLVFYSAGAFGASLVKRDLNLAPTNDTLEIEVESLNGTIVLNTAIPDDGNLSGDGELGRIQMITLNRNLLPGMYRLILYASNDTIITSLSLQNPAVFEHQVFLYQQTNATAPPSVTFRSYDGVLWLNSPDVSGLQSVSVLQRNLIQSVDIDKPESNFRLSLTTSGSNGTIKFSIPRMLLVSSGYFALAENQYFDPMIYYLTNQARPGQILPTGSNQARYYVADYETPTKDNGWLIGAHSWGADQFYQTSDRELSFTLRDIGYSTVAIDWIRITFRIPPLWARRIGFYYIGVGSVINLIGEVRLSNLRTMRLPSSEVTRTAIDDDISDG